jgi:hypothetical protein
VLIATAVADAMASRDMPFREAHEKVGQQLASLKARAGVRRHARRHAGEEKLLRRDGARACERGCDQNGREGGLKLPKGFVASGIRAGIRKKRPDLGLIVAERGANAAAVFTQNRFLAAPVVLAKASMKKTGGRVKAVVVNAGCAKR